jgi:hypothetical protein
MSQSAIISTIGAYIAKQVGADPTLVTALVAAGLLMFMKDAICIAADVRSQAKTLYCTHALSNVRRVAFRGGGVGRRSIALNVGTI